MVFEDMEINPIGILFGLLGGILAIVVMSRVEVNVIFKILSFILTAIVCYFMSSRIIGG